MLTADTVEPDAADAGDWRMRTASDVSADTPTPKHAARCNGCPVSVSGYTCSCSVRGWAKVRVRERWGNSDTFSNSVDKALGCKLRGMSERQQPRAKILHTLTTGDMDPRPPWIHPWQRIALVGSDIWPVSKFNTGGNDVTAPFTWTWLSRSTCFYVCVCTPWSGLAISPSYCHQVTLLLCCVC